MTETPAQDPYLCAAVVHADERREMLRDLAHMGMTVAREISNRVAYGDRPRTEPAPLFALIARCIRLTLALEARMEEEMLALRNGRLPNCKLDVCPVITPDPVFRLPGPELRTTSPKAERMREHIRTAHAQLWGGGEPPTPEKREQAERLEREYEHLIEMEFYDHRVFRSYREAAAALCNDLNLTPVWSGFTEERGFARDPARLRRDPEKGWIELPPEADDAAPPATPNPAPAADPPPTPRLE